MIEVFQSPVNGQWYFRVRASNRQIVAGSEGYSRKASAKRAARRFLVIASNVKTIKVIG